MGVGVRRGGGGLVGVRRGGGGLVGMGVEVV